MLRRLCELTNMRRSRKGVADPTGAGRIMPHASILPSPKAIIEWSGNGGVRPAAYSTPYVLGSGSYGCVIADAVVFPKSKTVKLSNRNEYVTKLATDAKSEFALATKIAKLVPDNVGVFPVDNIQCGITHRDIGHASRKIAQRCEEVFGGLLEKSLYNTVRKPVSRRRSARHSPVPQVCGIQYPRYYSDIFKFATEIPHTTMECLEIAAQLKSKLATMHAAGVLHLDIKGLNAALMNKPSAGALDARFADWGFAVIAKTAKDLNAGVYRTLQPSFKDYYTKSLCPFHVEAPVLQWQPVWNALIRGRTGGAKLEALKIIDRWCLENMIIEMIPIASDQVQYAKDAIKSLNREIQSTFSAYA
jgi:hypothetical protein